MDAMLAARRTRPLVIAGPRDLRPRLDALREALFPARRDDPEFPLEWIEMEPADPSGCSTSSSPPSAPGTPADQSHRAPHPGRRQDHGYTGDTEWTDEVARAARDADLLIAESYFYDKPVKWHLNYPDIVAHAAGRGPGG